MKVSKTKDCRCQTCDKDFHYLGITRHRAMHRNKQEDCVISYTHGNTIHHRYSIAREKVKP